MQKLLKLYITLVFLSSQLFSENYQKLVLIEFDNSSQDRYFDFYRQELPNIIKNHPSLNDIEMEYAGKIDPYLDSEKNNINTVLLMGKFFIEDSQIEISYSLYDMSTWKKINEKIFYCMVRDSECISSSMIVSATKAFSTIFTFEEPFIEEYHPKEDKQIISEDQLLFNEIYQALEDFAVEADLNYSWEKLNSEGQQFGTRYYKDIDENIQDKLVDDNKNLNTEKLLNFIDGILLNPYDVSIEDINIAFDEFESDYVNVEVPVKYNIKKTMIEAMLSTLPHNSESSKYGSVKIRFLNSDFNFTSDIEDRFAQMEYQVVPVMFLSNSLNQLKHVHIDSWNRQVLLSDIKDNLDIDISMSRDFYPLFSITPGDHSLLVHLDMTTLEFNYRFKFHIDEMDDLSKIAIKFLYESEIESAIDNLLITNN